MQDTLPTVERTTPLLQFRYSVRTIPETWVLTEEKVSESVPHDEAAERLKAILKAWAKRAARPVRIARNLAVRWLEADPRIGIDPDVCVLDPPPPDAEELTSLRLWVPGHQAPRLCFEVVSKNHPHKDYLHIQDRYAAMGTEELVVFDPLSFGPCSLGGPVLLQMWRRRGDLFERTDFGSAPVHSNVLGAWLLPCDRHLLVSDDPEGTRLWLDEAESAALREREATLREREATLRAEVLERELAELRGAKRSGEG